MVDTRAEMNYRLQHFVYGENTQIETSTPLTRNLSTDKDSIVGLGLADESPAERNKNQTQNTQQTGLLGASCEDDLRRCAENLRQELYQRNNEAKRNSGELSSKIQYEIQSTPGGNGGNRGSTDRNSTKDASRGFLSDPWKPYVLQLYLQLTVNVVLVAVAAYLGYLIVSTLRADIHNQVEQCVSDALHEISQCSKEYYRNKCHNDGSHKRAPLLEDACTNWERCMNRDPQLMAKSRVTAEMLAEILNAFLHRLSWKSLFVIAAIVFASFATTFLSIERLQQWPTQQQKRSTFQERLIENDHEAENDRTILLTEERSSELPVLNSSMISQDSPLSRKSSTRISNNRD